MAMLPHERSLAKKMEGKPFAIVGVNFDDTRDDLKNTEEKNKLPWRSFFDGHKDGPIGEQWNIHGLPTIYVLDAKGVIRYKNVFDKELDQAVDTLIKQVSQ
jgi:hypothetical protein